MKKFSKRIKLLNSLITKDNYPLKESISLLKKIETAKFTESVEAHIS